MFFTASSNVQTSYSSIHQPFSLVDCALWRDLLNISCKLSLGVFCWLVFNMVCWPNVTVRHSGHNTVIRDIYVNKSMKKQIVDNKGVRQHHSFHLRLIHTSSFERMELNRYKFDQFCRVYVFGFRRRK